MAHRDYPHVPLSIPEIPEYPTRATENYQLELGLGIVNRTGHALTVVTRTGLRFTVVPESRWSTERSVVFEQRFGCDRYTGVSIVPRDDDGYHASRSLAQRLYDVVREKVDARTGSNIRQNHRESFVKGRISYDTLMNCGGTVYVPELDILITSETHQNHPHPFCEEYILEAMKPSVSDARNGLSITLFIVSNAKHLSPRYINFNGIVLRIPITRNPSMKDGVYGSHPRRSESSGEVNHYIQTFMDLEEGEKYYRMYRTVEDAETFGFSKEALERENQTRKRESEERRYQREETAYERKESARETDDERARREGIRQDALDILKIISAVVMAVVGFCTAIIKFRSPTK